MSGWRTFRTILACGTLSACGTLATEAPLRIVTTIFPLTDWAREIGGEAVLVESLLPPGAEAHHYAPRPSDLRKLGAADIFIYMGPDMEPWAETLIRGVAERSVHVIEAGKNVPRMHAHDLECGRCGSDPSRGETDPHLWLDPVLASGMVRRMAEEMAKVAPKRKDEFLRRAGEYQARLDELHRQIEQSLRTCRRREILYAGHFTFGYFARRYGLTHSSPYPGFSPNAMPTPRQMAEITRKLRESGQSILFYEELSDPRVARMLAEEAGVQIRVLHGAHNLSREEAARGDVSYLSIMRQNLENLREALGCGE